MEYLTSLVDRLTRVFRSDGNLELYGSYHFRPHAPVPNDRAISAHQTTLKHSFRQFLTDKEIQIITDDYRRSNITEEAILSDFFANDVENHEIPFDEHVEYGLHCMAEAFRPPQKCLPAHLNDVEHHYPYKWQVNAEPPFATDDYFLNNRKTFGDYYDAETKTWKHYVNPEDAMRRHGPDPAPQTLAQVVPAKFGFMKDTIFSWTRRWHHVIKSGFLDTTGLENTTYFAARFIFPMLLHTKSAIVKSLDFIDKLRTIWGCSKPWIIADTMFYWEYIAYAKLNPGATPMLWSYETFS